jgi:CHAT domain-containing protein
LLDRARAQQKGEISWEQLTEIASSRHLARAATVATCERLVEMLQSVAHEPEETALVLAGVVNNHAIALYYLGRSSEALLLNDAILPIMRQQSPTADVAGCLANRGNFLHGLDRYPEAEAAYDEALPLFRQYRPPTDVAACLMHRAGILKDQGKYPEAIAGYNEALDLFRAHDSPANEAICLMGQADALQNLARYDEAVAGYDAALFLFRRHGPPSNEAFCLMKRANARQRQGRWSEAVVDYDAAESLFREHHLYSGLAGCLMNRATALEWLGQRKEALWVYSQAREVYRDHNSPADYEGMADWTLKWANALAHQGQWPEAIEAYGHALSAYRELGLTARVALCLMDRASAFAGQGRYDEAVAGYDDALLLYEDSGSRAHLNLCRLNRATALMEQGKHAEAVEGYQQVDTLVFQGVELCKYRYTLGKALRRTGQRAQALDHFTRGRQTLRRARRIGGIDEMCLEFVAEWRELFDEAVCCALELGLDEMAFEAVLDGKAGVFGDLRQRRNRQTDDEPAAVRAIRVRLVEWLRQSATLELSAADWHLKLTQEREAYLLELLQRTEAYLRSYRQARHGYRSDQSLEFVADAPISLAAIKAALPSDWAVLDFWQTTQEEVTAFVIFPDGLHVQKLPFPFFEQSFNSKLERLCQSIAEPLRRWHDEALDDLDAYLFAPLRKLLHDRRIRGLYLVPHSVLHAFPLHACRHQEKGKAVYLCDEFAVAYLPSAALLPQLPPLRWTGSIFSLANPERGTEATLPFSEWEGRQLRQRLAGPAEWFHVGPDATFAKTAAWEEAGLIHFTCHGASSPRCALLSHLRLADDLLLAHDVLYGRPSLSDGSLVILNGCETGVRDWRAVDEGMGLMSAFLLRGASLVLATQWSVLDACAAEMSVTFVEEFVQKGRSPTEALRKAQARARSMTAEEILARCEEVAQLFPADNYPEEAAKIHAQAALVSQRAGLASLARHHGEEGEKLLRRLRRDDEADRLAALTRGGAGAREERPRIANFDHPVFWSAFQLVGRVT